VSKGEAVGAAIKESLPTDLQNMLTPMLNRSFGVILKFRAD
jgi:hypothetical protein